MSTGVISRRYAKALMNLAAKENQVEDVAAGLDVLADSMADNPRLGVYLQDAKVPQAAKLETINQVLREAKTHRLVETFVRYIAHKRRITLLPEMREIFHRLADERMGRAQAEVTVAAPITQEQEAGILSQLEALSGKKITLSVRIDPEIIGGAITRIGSTVRDGSLRTQLHTLRQSILEG